MTNGRERTAEQCLLVRIGGRRYSLPVSGVEGVVSLRADALSAVPYDGGGRIRGIFNHRGAVVALLNCGGLEPQAGRDGREELTAVLLRSEGRRFAILVDGADAVAEEPSEQGSTPLDIGKLYSAGADNSDP